MLLHQAFGHLLERAEIGQAFGRARAKEHGHAACRAAALTLHGKGTHGRRPGAGTDQQQMRLRIAGHQEGRTKGACHLDLGTGFKVAQEIRRKPLGLAFHGQ